MRHNGLGLTGLEPTGLELIGLGSMGPQEERARVVGFELSTDRLVQVNAGLPLGHLHRFGRGIGFCAEFNNTVNALLRCLGQGLQFCHEVPAARGASGIATARGWADTFEPAFAEIANPFGGLNRLDLSRRACAPLRPLARRLMRGATGCGSYMFDPVTRGRPDAITVEALDYEGAFETLAGAASAALWVLNAETRAAVDALGGERIAGKDMADRSHAVALGPGGAEVGQGAGRARAPGPGGAGQGGIGEGGIGKGRANGPAPGLPPCDIALHVRRGDKITEFSYVPVEMYLQALAPHRGAGKTLFIASDDAGLVRELGAALTGDFEVLSPVGDSVVGDSTGQRIGAGAGAGQHPGPQGAQDTSVDGGAAAGVGYDQGTFNALSAAARRQQIVGLLAEIEMLRRAGLFIGASTSNVFITLRRLRGGTPHAAPVLDLTQGAWSDAAGWRKF